MLSSSTISSYLVSISLLYGFMAVFSVSPFVASIGAAVLPARLVPLQDAKDARAAHIISAANTSAALLMLRPPFLFLSRYQAKTCIPVCPLMYKPMLLRYIKRFGILHCLLYHFAEVHHSFAFPELC